MKKNTFYLRWIDDCDNEMLTEISDRVYIGRHKDIDTFKCIKFNSNTISRFHAFVSLEENGLTITDFSKNGTWVNGTRLTSGLKHNLIANDIIKIGKNIIKVVKLPKETENEESAKYDSSTFIEIQQSVIVTNVVVDVRGFTSMTQKQDCKDTFIIMREIFEVFSRIIRDYNGTVKDYAGDAVFSFWVHEDKLEKNIALKACHATLSQKNSIQNIENNVSDKLNRTYKLNFGWGITTGNVTISHYGERYADIAVVGDCTNLAFRLSSIANKEIQSQIILCEETATLVKDDIEIIDLQKIKTKGRKGKEHIYGVF